jgi:hypothetical protein
MEVIRKRGRERKMWTDEAGEDMRRRRIKCGLMRLGRI